MSDHDTYDREWCRERFAKNEDKIDEVAKTQQIVLQLLNNGLVTKVKNIMRVLWLLVGAIIVDSIVGRIF